MRTYQDLIEVGEDEKALRNFVRSTIEDHKNTDLFKIAAIAEEYDRRRNVTIMQYQKTLTTMTGEEVPDRWSPNHKTTRGFFNYFTTQQNQFLLGNGVTWKNGNGDKLGDDFDTQLQKLGKHALVGGVAFGFWNYDHMEVFRVTEFVPLLDEENGSLRAGIRFWQIDRTKPLRATLYEEDGYTDYIWSNRDAETAGGAVLHPKRTYKQVVRSSEVDGEEIMDGENYPTFPIVPLWGNPHHQSELVGIREQIDAYDFIKNGFLNDLDTAQVYWILKNAGGMDDDDMSRFIEQLHMRKDTDVDDGTEVEEHTIEIPYAAREELLNRLEKDLYKDYMALNVEDIKGGAVTATQIRAAYEPMNVKADQYEYCLHEFIKALLEVAGIEDEATFTRSMLVNVGEEVETVLQAATALTDDYVTRKILTLLGDGDMADDMLKEKDAEGMDRMTEEQTNPIIQTTPAIIQTEPGVGDAIDA